jgi:acetyl esterase/lipase
MKKLLLLLILCVSSELLTAQDSISEDRETRIYAVKDSEELYLDIYSPEVETDDKLSVIIFMHGGGFSAGSPRNESLIKMAKVANDRGYVSVMISYRLTRKGKSFSCGFEASGKMETFEKSAEDFMDAVSYIHENSDDFNIDPAKIVVGGSSAGAEAVLNAVYNSALMFEDVSRYSDINIAGVLSMAGAIVDARYISEEMAIPAVFFHGTDDNLVPYGTAPHHYCDETKPGYIYLDGSRTIADKLKEYNSSYLLFTYEGARHEISGVQFDQLDQTFDFFDRILEGEKSVQIELTK